VNIAKSCRIANHDGTAADGSDRDRITNAVDNQRLPAGYWRCRKRDSRTRRVDEEAMTP